MKTITREVMMYRYVFANIDLATGTAHNMVDINKPEPMGHRAIKAYCEAHDNAVLIHKDQGSVKYSMPLSLFVQTCEEYAKQVEAGEAEPISEEDTEADYLAEEEPEDDTDEDYD